MKRIVNPRETMLERFRQFVSEEDLFHAQHRLLVAVSGGVDSVVLAHLVARGDAEMALAHINYQLRGADSDADQALTEALAEQLDCPFFSTRCATETLMEEGGVSMQMAARAFRYEWLESIRANEGYDWILLGHHLQDSIETVLHHFTRGTGLRGLHGIPLRRGRVLRPLLFATREEILAYAREEKLEYREDDSNLDPKYTRNKIRYQVIPPLREINPRFIATAAANIRRMREATYLMDLGLAQLREELVREEGDRLYFDLEGLLHHYPAAGTILYEWLEPFGFHADQVMQMLDSAGRQPGGTFLSSTHQVTIDRETLILDPLATEDGDLRYFLNQEAECAYLPDGVLHLEWKEEKPDFFPVNPYVALLDIPPTAFPLEIRHWREGDAFCPLGMGGKHQKLQDFFTNQKVPRPDKDRIWLLQTRSGEICWVIGYRVDERFRITENTAGYVHLHFRNEER